MNSREEIQSLSAEQPWPGLTPFTEEGTSFFHGREDETAELVRLVKRGMLTILFSQSGLGKSSLIRAGAFPLLRAEGYFPIYVRLDHSPAAPHPLEQVRSIIAGEVAAHRIDAVAPAPELTLWEYFHTRRHEFWNERNELLTVLLILDQFEEIFTLGQSSPEVIRRTHALIRELADLIENRIPDAVSARAESDIKYVQGINYSKDVCKVLITLREDFLPDFEGLRRELPSSIQNRMRLKPMNGRQALRAVKDTGGALVTQAVAEQIVRFVAGPRADHAELEWERVDIEPALLSVVCRELNTRRLRDGAAEISGDLLVSGAQTQIIAEFYERSFEGLDPRLKLFVEDRLLTASGHRDSVALEDAVATPGVTREGVDRLIVRRVLRLEERFGALRVELTHDLLTRVIRENRDLRNARAAEEAALARTRLEGRRFRRLTVTAAVLGAGVLAMGLLLLKTVQSERLLAERSRAVLSQKLAATSRSLIQREPDVGWLLGVEALQVADTSEARRNLIEAERLTEPTLKSYYPRIDIGRASDIAVANDATIAVTAHRENMTAAVWDLTGNKLLHVLRGHRGGVVKVAFSADGRILYTGADNGGVRIWDARSGQALRRFIAHDAALTALTTSHDGLHLAAGFDDGTIKVYRAAAPFDVVTTARAHATAIRALAFATQPVRLIAGDSNGTLSLWNVQTGQRLGDVQAGKKDVLAIHSPLNGALSVAVTQSGDVARFRVANDRILVDSVSNWIPPVGDPDHPGALEAVAIDAVGDRIALGFTSGRLGVWGLGGDTAAARGTEPPRNRLLETLRQGNQHRITAIAFHPTAPDVISASSNGSVVRSTLEPARASRQVLTRSGLATRTAFASAPSGSRIVARLTNTDYEVIHLLERRIERIIRVPERKCSAYFMAAAGAGFMIDCGGVRTFAFSSGLLLAEIEIKASVKRSADNRHVLRDSRDVMETATGGVLFRGTSLVSNRFTVLPERNLALFLDGATLLARDTRNGQVIDKKQIVLEGESQWFWVSGDGSSILTKRWQAGTGTILAVWETDSFAKKAEWTLKDQPGFFVNPALTLAVLQRGRRLSLSRLEGAQLREVELVNPDPGKTEIALKTVTFSPDSRYVLTEAVQGLRFALWDAATGKFVDAPFSNLTEDELQGIQTAGFVGDGSALFAVTAREVLFQDTNIGLKATARACAIANRNLTVDEWKRYLGNEPYRQTCPTP